MLNKISLFTGIGSDDLASEWVGINTICFVEKEPYCQKVLKKLYPNVPIIEDVHNVTKEKIKEVSGYESVDIISGGYPCQGESIAGKRGGKTDNRWLWPEMFRIIRIFRPTWVVGENVANHVNMGLNTVLSDLESIRYRARSFLIPACAVNAIHLRERIITIANSNSDGMERCRLSPNISQNRSGGASSKTYLFNQKEFTPGYSCESESELIRANDGTPYWKDRVKSIGNTVVPQTLYPFYKAIVDIENIKSGII